jgi:hypothetical protein
MMRGARTEPDGCGEVSVNVSNWAGMTHRVSQAVNASGVGTPRTAKHPQTAENLMATELMVTRQR